jgi:hypothetical protein
MTQDIDIKETNIEPTKNSSSSFPTYNLENEVGSLKAKPSAFWGAIYCAGLGSIFVFPLIWHFLRLKFTTYYLTTHRLRIHTGILNKRVGDIELFRVRDMEYTIPCIFLLTPLGNIAIYSEDLSQRIAHLEAIPNYYLIFEEMRKLVYQRRLEVPPLWK